MYCIVLGRMKKGFKIVIIKVVLKNTAQGPQSSEILFTKEL